MKEKLTKEKIKKFWSEHKLEIIGVTLIGSGLIMGFTVLGKGKKLPDKLTCNPKFDWDEVKAGLSEDGRLYAEMLEVIDKVKEGGTVYVPISSEEFKRLNDGCTIISCGNGAELMDVTGLIAFGNKIEAES